MESSAQVKIKNGDLTDQEIRVNHPVILMEKDEKLCVKCNKVKNKNEFPEKRRQCRNSVRSKFGKDFDDQVEEHVEKLK
jgi:hypothetical protein